MTEAATLCDGGCNALQVEPEGDAIVTQVAIRVLQSDPAEDLHQPLLDKGRVPWAGEHWCIVDVAHPHEDGGERGGGGGVLDLVRKGVSGDIEVGAVVGALGPIEVVKVAWSRGG